MANYYIIVNNKQQGPYSIAQLRQLNITPQTPVWAQGMADWTIAARVDDLKPLFVIQKQPRNAERALLYTGVALAFLSVIALGIYFAIQYKESTANSTNPSTDTATVEALTPNPFNKDSADAAFKAAEETRLRTEKERSMRQAREGFYTQYNIKVKSYKTDVLGGISDVFIEVTNASNYTINSLTFVINYYKSNGDVWLSEELTATNIAPQSTQLVQGPNTERGTKVETGMVMRARVNEIAYCYEAGNWAAGINDPYKCQE